MIESQSIKQIPGCIQKQSSARLQKPKPKGTKSSQ
jgi:hypothetical protein